MAQARGKQETTNEPDNKDYKQKNHVFVYSGQGSTSSFVSRILAKVKPE